MQAGDGAGGPLKVILVGNYPPDGQQSMLRFAAVLKTALDARGHDVELVSPRDILGPARNTGRGVDKCLGYFDKFVLFPWSLRAAARRARTQGGRVVVHICDHSNAVYTRHLNRVPHIVTCNDLLAVRSARGEFAENPTRWSGRLLQRWILSGLRDAQLVACISEATRADVLRLTERSAEAIQLIYMGLNYPFARMPVAESGPLIDSLFSESGFDVMSRPPARPFILHVGGNQWYKNRPGVLQMYAGVRDLAPASGLPALVMAGQPFSAPMRALVARYGLQRDVFELTDVPDRALVALYSQADLLLYPSLAEGFGWPVAEAMACGCRVVTSNRPPLTEVGGAAATFIDPEDPPGAAASILRVLAEPAAERRRHVDEGLRQQRKFSTDHMIDRYIAAYDELAVCV